MLRSEQHTYPVIVYVNFDKLAKLAYVYCSVFSLLFHFYCMHIGWYCCTVCIATAKHDEKRSEATQTLRAGCSKAEPQTDTQTHKQTAAITIHCVA